VHPAALIRNLFGHTGVSPDSVIGCRRSYLSLRIGVSPCGVREESGMPRFRVSPFALALLVVMVAVMPRLDGAQEATLAATPLAKPQPPTQPTTGPGSSEALFGGVTAIKQALPDQFFADSWLFVPTDPLPGTTRSGKPFPLVIFVPGSGAVDADLYLAWIEHLVQRCPEDYATSTERVAAISHQAMAPRCCGVAKPTRSLVTALTL